jgi:thymidylate synthase (FAD)
VVNFDPLQDDISRLELIDSMGNDLSVVNDARASFDKQSTEWSDADRRLLITLLTAWPQHTSPLRGVVLKFRVKAPLGIARQWWKHVVGSSHYEDQLQHNEKSFRYSEIDDPDEFYIPKVFRTQSTRNKQSSADPLGRQDNNFAKDTLAYACKVSFDVYKGMLEVGVCREQARLVLNPAIYTSWVWTASLQAALNFISLRRHSAAQSEIALYAADLAKCVESVAPETYAVWDEIRSELDPVIIEAMNRVKDRLKGQLAP